jgi:HSP20 family molecular chaperone IbpA
MTALLPRLFGDVSEWFDSEFPLRLAHMIRVEDIVDEQKYILRAEVPGVDPEKDIEVKVSDGLLTVQAERSEPADRNRTEFRYGSLQRTVRLPTNAAEDKIKATYRDGILEVIVPLTAAKPAGREIPISIGK